MALPARTLPVCLVVLAAALSGLSPATAGPAEPALVLLDDGATVFDPVTKLTWARCAEGSQWDGRGCAGAPLQLNHAQALARAKARSRTENAAWRLPSVTQLRQVAGKAARWQGPPLFPGEDADWCWTMTASLDTTSHNPYNYGAIMREQAGGTNRLAFLHGWAVNLRTGEARGDVSKGTELAVRLVRLPR